MRNIGCKSGKHLLFGKCIQTLLLVTTHYYKYNNEDGYQYKQV